MSFSRLPREVKWQIWEYELHHERLLRIKLEPRSVIRSFDAVHKVSDEYRIVVLERQPMHKLFYLTSESRAFARNFYRVHLPCQYRWKNKIVKSGTLYFNPELDHLEVRGWRGYFAQFSHDTWALDRRHVGLVNLMVGTNQVMWDFYGFSNALGESSGPRRVGRAHEWYDHQESEATVHTEWPEFVEDRMKEALLRLKRVTIIPEWEAGKGFNSRFTVPKRADKWNCPLNMLHGISEVINQGTRRIYRHRPVANTLLSHFKRIPSEERLKFHEAHIRCDTFSQIESGARGLNSWFRMLRDYKLPTRVVDYRFMCWYSASQVGLGRARLGSENSSQGSQHGESSVSGARDTSPLQLAQPCEDWDVSDQIALLTETVAGDDSQDQKVWLLPAGSCLRRLCRPIKDRRIKEIMEQAWPMDDLPVKEERTYFGWLFGRNQHGGRYYRRCHVCDRFEPGRHWLKEQSKRQGLPVFRRNRL